MPRFDCSVRRLRRGRLTHFGGFNIIIWKRFNPPQAVARGASVVRHDARQRPSLSLSTSSADPHASTGQEGSGSSDVTHSSYFVALNVFSLLGNTAMGAQPLIVGALVDLVGLSARQAGFVSAAEMGGFATGMLALLRFGQRVRRRTLALAALSTIAAANAASPLAGEFHEILSLRFVNGFAAAASYSVFLTMAAATRRPELDLRYGAAAIFGSAHPLALALAGALPGPGDARTGECRRRLPHSVGDRTGGRSDSSSLAGSTDARQQLRNCGHTRAADDVVPLYRPRRDMVIPGAHRCPCGPCAP